MALPVWEMEGTWEEIAAHAPQLAGRRVRLTVLPGNGDEAPQTPRAPNLALLEAIKKVAEIQKGMNPTEAGDTVALIREARSGAMYGDDPAE